MTGNEIHREVHDHLTGMGPTSPAVARALLGMKVRGVRHSAEYNPVCAHLRAVFSYDFVLARTPCYLDVSHWDGQMICSLPMPSPVVSFLAEFDAGMHPALVRKDDSIRKVDKQSARGGLVRCHLGDGRTVWATITSLALAMRHAYDRGGKRAKMTLGVIVETLPSPEDCPFDADPPAEPM